MKTVLGHLLLVLDAVVLTMGMIGLPIVGCKWDTLGIVLGVVAILPLFFAGEGVALLIWKHMLEGDR